MNLGSKMNFVKATKAEIFAYVETFSLVIAVQTVNEAAVSGWVDCVCLSSAPRGFLFGFGVRSKSPAVRQE